MCCCEHSHTKDCPFIKFVEKECGGDMAKACKLLHQDSCDCYKRIVKANAEMQPHQNFN